MWGCGWRGVLALGATRLLLKEGYLLFSSVTYSCPLMDLKYGCLVTIAVGLQESETNTGNDARKLTDVTRATTCIALWKLVLFLHVRKYKSKLQVW